MFRINLDFSRESRACLILKQRAPFFPNFLIPKVESPIVIFNFCFGSMKMRYSR